MAKKKKTRDQKKRERHQRKIRFQQSRGKIDIHKEIAYIIGRAQEGDARVVKYGTLAFFSTQTRDAWMLDLEDDFALCLARDGVAQPVQIIDTPEQFGIDWDRKFQIENDLFITVDRSGKVTTIAGYPVANILNFLGQVKGLGP